MSISLQNKSLDAVKKYNLTIEQKALIELTDSGLRFALLREPLSWETIGDIDIVVSELNEAEEKLLHLSYIKFSTSYGNRKFIRYDWHEEEWIHLDVQSTLFFGDIETPAVFIKELLDRSVLSETGIPYLDPLDEAILTILHLAIDKGCISSKYRERMFNYESSPELFSPRSYSFLPKSLDYYLDIIKQLREGNMNNSQAIERIRSTFNLLNNKELPFLRRVLRRIKILRKGNPAIVFLGPDGSGKSTLTEPLAKLKWPMVHRQFMGPAREEEMRKCFYRMMKYTEGFRDKYSRKHVIGILSRGIWQIICYIDFWDRIIRHINFCSKEGVLICDRYPCDMYFRKPTWWNEFLFIKLFPKPRFVFLCVGDPENIYNRKPELSSEQIKNTIYLYRKKIVHYKVPYKEINTSEHPAKKVLIEVIQYLINNKWLRY